MRKTLDIIHNLIRKSRKVKKKKQNKHNKQNKKNNQFIKHHQLSLLHLLNCKSWIWNKKRLINNQEICKIELQNLFDDLKIKNKDQNL